MHVVKSFREPCGTVVDGRPKGISEPTIPSANASEYSRSTTAWKRANRPSVFSASSTIPDTPPANANRLSEEEGEREIERERD